jgi:two-component system, sensor histidine kinase and response regulator
MPAMSYPYTRTQKRFHILIADDDFVTAVILRRMLEPEYRVTVVENGHLALDTLSRESIDLTIIDINMPIVDGFEVLKTIRNTPSYAYLPVILVSAMVDSDDIARGLKLGANDYLTKPIDRQITLARVNTQLQLKALMDAHQQAIEELQAAQQMRDRFFSIASHDLKNPMNNIRMAQFLLREYLEHIPNAMILLNNIDLSLESMQEIVHDFLDNAVLQGHALDLELECLKVEDLLWEVVMQYNISAHKKRILLDTGDVEGVVVGDRSRLTQALSNLVSNAIKYSPIDSVVTLCTAAYKDRIRINVSDHGPGIPDNEHDMLFKEFGKLSNRPTAGETSTGLGLWIVKQLVTLQNGCVGFESPANGGSIFWIEMPMWIPDNSAVSNNQDCYTPV